MILIFKNTSQKSVIPAIHPFVIPKWRQRFEDHNECIIHQANYHDINQVIFFPYTNVENLTPYPDTVAIFKVKRKITNMMIADNIINQAIQPSIL